MSQQIHIKKHRANIWLILLGCLVLAAITGAFAYQTFQFVSWLMPADDWLMKTVAMFSFDGCCAGYALFDMFWKFRLRKAKEVVFNMWIFTLACSTIASVVQMYLASTHLIPSIVPNAVVYLSYAIVVAVFVVNMICIYYVFRLEYVARHPEGSYEDDAEYEQVLPPVRVTLAQTAPVPALPAPKEPALVQAQPTSPDTTSTATQPKKRYSPDPAAIHAKRMDRLKRQHQKPLTPAQEDMKQKIRESVQPTNPQTALPTNQANGQSRKVKQLPPMKY